VRITLLAVCLFFSSPLLAETLLPLPNAWQLQSKASVPEDGAIVSTEDFNASGWYETVVPRTVLAALVDNGVFPDPYYGENMKAIPGYKDGLHLVLPEGSPFRSPWWYRRVFDAPADWQAKFVTLHLDGVNFQANVWLNGKRIADQDTVRGMFRRFEFPVGGYLKPGETNVLAIEVVPPGLIPDKEYNTKQIEATTGWDDHNPQPPDMNMGLWEDVYFKAQGPVSLRNVYVEPELALPGLENADLTVSVQARNNTDAPVEANIRVSIESTTLNQTITLNARETREIFFKPADYPALHFANPRVWWPHPLGSPELYAANLEARIGDALSDEISTRFGIREITSYVNEEDWRVYEVNGKNILIRGGAWMTTDMLLRLSDERYESLIRYAKEANLNMLRSEGFSIRETEEFYNLCDEMGVMVTQQIFGRSIPDEALATACIDDMLLRIRNHPSLAHFLGHDETFPTDNLDANYRRMIEDYRLDRTYQPHSGTFNVLTRKKTGGTRTGTRELWTYAGPSHYYLRKPDGAWGFAQSGGIGGILAADDSLAEMMPEESLWPPLETSTFSFHTVTQGASYFQAVLDAMTANYGAPSDAEDFKRKLYAMNFNSARGMYEAYGRNKYDASGITTWKYNAAWPAALTWHYVDWYLRPTAAYFGAQAACEPLHIQYAYDDESVYVVNGKYEAVVGLKAHAVLYDWDLKERWRSDAEVNVGADGVARAFRVRFDKDLSATHFLLLTLENADGETVSRNFYWLSTTPDEPGRDGNTLTGVYFTKPNSTADFTAFNQLAPATIEATAERDESGSVKVTVKNTGDTLAYQLRLALLDSPEGRELPRVYWNANYLSLLPGESINLRAQPAQGLNPSHLRIRGWNTTETALSIE